MADGLSELREIARLCDEAAKLRDARALARDALIRELFKRPGGPTLAQMALAAGLSKQRVQQIAHDGEG